MKSITENVDCMIRLREAPDKHWDLAIVDPPYGVGYARGKHGFGDSEKGLYRSSPKVTNWDKAVPSQEYFNELRRVSANQIIWGGNYFTDKLPVSKCWLVWDKVGLMQCKNPFADCELAWTNLRKVVKKFTLRQVGFIKDTKDGERIHPTQKPTELYRWLLQNYAEPGWRILDTHLGSGSSRIAAHDLGFDFTGYEMDGECHRLAENRFQQHIGRPVTNTVREVRTEQGTLI